MLMFVPTVDEEQQLPLIENDQNLSPIHGATEALQRLRFTIVTKARTMGDSRTPKSDRAQLNTELTELRARYLNKVDEIAMQLGVAEALNIKKQVEKEIDEFEQMRRRKGL